LRNRGSRDNTDDTTIAVITRPFDSWRNTNFSSGELANESISGPAADADGDGLNNAEEYFFATAPKVFNTQSPFRGELINGHPAMVWTQRMTPMDVTVTPQRADRIEGPWFGGPGLFEYTEALMTQPDSIQVRLRALVPATASSQQFIRLQLDLIE